MTETLLTLDTFNLLFRSFTSLPQSIVGADGRPIHAVYGLISAIMRLRRDHGCDRMVAAFDVPEVPTFRHKLYPAYQGQRGPLGGEGAAEFLRQVELAKTGLPAVGVPALSYPGYEADDIMGTLSSLAGTDLRVVAVSTDRDLLQLVDDNVAVLVPNGPLLASEDDVRAKMGVAPSGIPTLKALSGDASDNIPGIRGIGPKTAAALVNRYGSLEDIYAHLQEQAPRQQTLLEGGKTLAFLFRDVVTIRRDLALDFDMTRFPGITFARDAGVRQVLTDMGLPQPPSR